MPSNSQKIDDANSLDHDQTAPLGAVWSWPKLFVSVALCCTY